MAKAETTDEGVARGSAEPSAVSMAVLGVEGALVCAALFVAVLGAQEGPGGGEPLAALAVVPLMLVLTLFAGGVLTAAYVVPAVRLAHWTARQLTGRTAWWWIPPACTLWVLPALAVPAWHLAGLGLYAVTLPPALAVHVTVVRARAGRPVQPCAAILSWGALAVGCVVIGGGAVVAVG